VKRKVFYSSKGLWEEREEEMLEEVPLSVYVNGFKLSTLFRTPGEDEALLMGLCFTEGIIREKEEIASMRIGEDVAEVRIKGRYKGRSEPKGIEETLRELKRKATVPLKPEGERVRVDQLLECTRVMESSQRLRKRTGASHAAMLFSYKLEPISMAEDVGRHNAFDKAIGKALMEGRLDEAFIATLSSRISFEMAKKAAMIGVKILVGTSRATSMAVFLGEELKMTVVSVTKTGDVILYTSPLPPMIR